jgi:predicted transcriptional regulator
METVAPKLTEERPGEHLRTDRVDTRWGPGTRPGFTAVPNALIHSQAELGLSANDLVVALNLLSHWWYRERLVFPGTALIAKRTGMHVRNVQRTISKLQKLGLIKRVKRGTGGSAYEFDGLIEATERMAEKHEWRSRKVQQRLPAVPIPLEDAFDLVGFNEV